MTPISRRRALQQTFFFSAALALGSRARLAPAQEITAAAGDSHFLMIGDWGSGAGPAQRAVAAGLKGYVTTLGKAPDGLFLLGDNFYGAFPGGLESPRWREGFEEMYPASVFPGPCWAVLGNHDYDDEPVTKIAAELAYAGHRPGTRWTMPAKWYRFEWPTVNPLFTCLVLDSNWKNRAVSLTPDERIQQAAWLEAELKKPRTTPWRIVLGHHPLYSNGQHGDHPHLSEEWGPLFETHGVDCYFAGHDHDLQHLEFEGRRTSFVVSGGGGARVRDLKNEGRGPFSRAVYGFTHLQVGREKLVVRHLDANQKLLHTFHRTPDGQVHIGV